MQDSEPDRLRLAWSALAGCASALVFAAPWFVPERAWFVGYATAFGFVPLAVTAKMRARNWAIGGACCAGLFHGYALLAFWPATRFFAISGPLIQAGIWSLTLGLGAWVAGRIGSRAWHAVAVSGTCFAVQHLVDRTGLPLVPVTAGLVTVDARLLSPVTILGVPLVDAMTVFAGVVIANRAGRTAVGGAAFMVLVFTAGLLMDRDTGAARQSRAAATVHVVQPRIAPEDHHATG